jgi:hypothetical protein
VTAIASKICSKCKKKLPATAKFFFRDFRRKDDLANPCKLCKKKYARSKHAKIMNRGRAMKYLYGLKVAEYNRLFSIQNGRCAICGKHQSELKRRLDVDHDHKTDEVRGLLCNCCNKIIERHINSPSWFKNPIIVNRLNEYLK